VLVIMVAVLVMMEAVVLVLIMKDMFLVMLNSVAAVRLDDYAIDVGIDDRNLGRVSRWLLARLLVEGEKEKPSAAPRMMPG